MLVNVKLPNGDEGVLFENIEEAGVYENSDGEYLVVLDFVGDDLRPAGLYVYERCVEVLEPDAWAGAFLKPTKHTVNLEIV